MYKFFLILNSEPVVFVWPFSQVKNFDLVDFLKLILNLFSDGSTCQSKLFPPHLILNNLDRNRSIYPLLSMTCWCSLNIWYNGKISASCADKLFVHQSKVIMQWKEKIKCDKPLECCQRMKTGGLGPSLLKEEMSLD